MSYPQVPAAFINAIAEEGTKAEAVEWLQKQWNETCALRTALKDVVSDILEYERVNNLSPNPGRKFCWDSVARAYAILEQ